MGKKLSHKNLVQELHEGEAEPVPAVEVGGRPIRAQALLPAADAPAVSHEQHGEQPGIQSALMWGARYLLSHYAQRIGRNLVVQDCS